MSQYVWIIYVWSMKWEVRSLYDGYIDKRFFKYTIEADIVI